MKIKPTAWISLLGFVITATASYLLVKARAQQARTANHIPKQDHPQDRIRKIMHKAKENERETA
jgi:hypothetical protein